NVQRFHHLGSGDLTDAVDLGSGANQFLLSRVNRLGGPVGTLASWGCRIGGAGSAAFCRSQDVLLADASANARAFDGVEVDAMLVSQLANQWRDIRNVVAGVDLRGGLRSRLLGLFRSFLLRSFLLWLLLLRFSLGLFLLRSFLLWLLLLRFSLGLFLLRSFLLGLFLLRFFLWLVLLVVGRWLGVFVADACDDGADVDGVVFVCEDFDQGACYWGRDLGIDLVGGDLE